MTTDMDSPFVFGVRVEGDAFTGQIRRERKDEAENKGVEGRGCVIMPE